MSHRRFATLLVALTAIGMTAPLHAQARSTIDPRVLDAAVVTRPDSNRAAISSALTSGNALAVAAGMGISRDAVASRIAALDEAGVQKVHDQMLAGGDSNVVISTTAIIIGLLILILLTR